MTTQQRKTRRVIARIVTAVVNELRDDPVVTPRLFTVKNAATYLGRSTRAVQSLIHNGSLTVVRIDRRAFLDRNNLDNLIDGSKGS